MDSPANTPRGSCALRDRGGWWAHRAEGGWAAARAVCAGYPHLPSPTELLAGPVPVASRKTQAVKHCPHSRIDCVASLQPELLRHRGVPLELFVMFGAGVFHFGQFMLEPAALFLQPLQISEDRPAFFKHGAPAGKQPVLWQISEGKLARADDLSFVRRQNPRQDLHQGRFARAVITDE